MFFFKDEEMRPIFLSKNYENLLGMPLSDVLGKSMYDLFPEDLAKSMIEDDKKVLEGGKLLDIIENLDRQIFATTKFPIKRENKPDILAGFTMDITNLKQAEEQVKKMLVEKVVLLKETHHRVKNNMAIISSLLGIQADYLEDEKAKEALNECRDRVISMQLIYDKLYQSENFVDLDIKSYFTDLINVLFKTYNVGSSQIKLELNIDDITLEMKKVVPCGFIINELVTNSLKYAFPERRKGTLSVSLNQEEIPETEKSNKNRYKLIVADDGIGFREDADIYNSSGFGIQLVKIFVEQLGANLEIAGEKGTRCTINF